ncbi:MAG: ATP/GTP-binding protein, partial [Fervidicoccaceae archaeon]
MERYYVLVVGPAGSGKTTLVKALGDWMESLGISYCRVNLDPAVEWIPYSPDVDVREFVDARKVAEE